TSPEEFHSHLAKLQYFRNHGIADVLDGDVTASGGAWVACEHFDGVPLPDLMEAGPLEAILAIEMVLQICEGLANAPAEGLIHGDIHPCHIVSVEDDDVRLCGLGIVQLFGPPCEDNLFDAPEYRAPEMFAGGPRPVTDIYSIGMILYLLIAGRPACRDV